jgi:hypothetical protein
VGWHSSTQGVVQDWSGMHCEDYVDGLLQILFSSLLFLPCASNISIIFSSSSSCHFSSLASFPFSLYCPICGNGLQTSDVVARDRLWHYVSIIQSRDGSAELGTAGCSMYQYAPLDSGHCTLQGQDYCWTRLCSCLYCVCIYWCWYTVWHVDNPRHGTVLNKRYRLLALRNTRNGDQ